MDPCCLDPLHMYISFDVPGQSCTAQHVTVSGQPFENCGNGCRGMALPPTFSSVSMIKIILLFEAKHRKCVPGGLTAHVTGMI